MTVSADEDLAELLKTLLVQLVDTEIDPTSLSNEDIEDLLHVRRLESISPAETVDEYLKTRKRDASGKSHRKFESHLRRFEEFCEEQGIIDMNDLTGRDLHQFVDWREADGELEKISLHGQTATLRVFLRYAEAIEAVPEGLADKVPVPDVNPEDEVSDVYVEPDEDEAIREYLSKFEYASRRHVLYLIISETGMRQGAVMSLDLKHFDENGQKLILKHLPSEGTTLKNGSDGERHVNITGELTQVIRDYVKINRDDVKDDFDRMPLVTTSEGRITESTFRKEFYKLTRPCVYLGECPHDYAFDECEAFKQTQASKCDFSLASHAIRKGSIMRQLDEGVPKSVVSDRCDTGIRTLELHYDLRGDARSARQRREVLEEHLGRFDQPDVSEDEGAGLDAGGQQSLGDFSVHAATPVTLPVIATEATSDRLVSELHSMAENNERVRSAAKQKAVQAASMYVCFVVLLGIDLALFGVNLNPLFV